MKTRQPRKKPFSTRWARLVWPIAQISYPTKKQRKALAVLWFDGYSYKDAGLWLLENMPEDDSEPQGV